MTVRRATMSLTDCATAAGIEALRRSETMATKTTRKIVHIDEEKCNGCGLCVPACAEGAIQIVDGKARLVADQYCDGLGACLGECPQDAITIIERDADEFDEEAVERRLATLDKHAAGHEHKHAAPTPTREHPRAPQPHAHPPLGGCPGSRMLQFDAEPAAAEPDNGAPQPSQLRQWPVQLALVPPTAPYFQGTELVIAADCAPFAYADFHRDFLKGKAVVVGCPKLDDLDYYREKLTAILSQSDVNSVTVLHMEVPCCFGIVMAAREAVQASGKDIPLKTVTITVRGQAHEPQPV